FAAIADVASAHRAMCGHGNYNRAAEGRDHFDIDRGPHPSALRSRARWRLVLSRKIAFPGTETTISVPLFSECLIKIFAPIATARSRMPIKPKCSGLP